MSDDEKVLFRGQKKAEALRREAKKQKRLQERKDWWSNRPALKKP